jgi:hypothetical protein
MSFFTRLNIRRRFNFFVFGAVFLAAGLLVVAMYGVMSTYAYEYTCNYWQDYTRTFAESAAYPVIIDSASVAAVVSHNHIQASQVIKRAAVYTTGHRLFASAGQAEDCTSSLYAPDKPYSIDRPGYWCFSAPVNKQQRFIGNVELVVLKTDFNAVVHRLLLASLVVVGLFSGFIYLMVSQFSRLFTSTIVDMVDVLKIVGQGGRGQRVSFSGTADIDMMRDVFNDMLSKVELNEQILGQMVDDRTHELRLALASSQSATIYKSRIMALVTHEMKTPLHATINFMQTVLKGLPDSPEFEQLRDYQSRALVRSNE